MDCGLDPFHFRELLERRDTGLVRHHVLALPHGPHRDAGPLVRNRRGDDEVDFRIFEQALGLVDSREVGKALEEATERLRLAFGPEPRARTAEREKPADLMVDVAMIETDRRESKRGFRHVFLARVFPAARILPFECSTVPCRALYPIIALRAPVSVARRTDGPRVLGATSAPERKRIP